jgi:rare lipoprotein A
VKVEGAGIPDAMIHGLVILLSVLITTAVNAGESGMASHYATRDKDQNRNRTACGPPLRDHGLTAAHKSLPCGARIRVTNKGNGRSTIVTITDRGPFVRGRVIDLSIGAAQALGFHGLARVTLGRI